MSDETLDELFRNAAENIIVEFEPSSWDNLKNLIENGDVLEVLQKPDYTSLPDINN